MPRKPAPVPGYRRTTFVAINAAVSHVAAARMLCLLYITKSGNATTPNLGSKNESARKTPDIAGRFFFP
jgi:hypothetical protein